jgi:hypothetical protein
MSDQLPRTAGVGWLSGNKHLHYGSAMVPIFLDCSLHD